MHWESKPNRDGRNFIRSRWIWSRYGGANGGIINVTSKSGGQKLAASVETVRDLGETTAGTNQDKISIRIFIKQF